MKAISSEEVAEALALAQDMWGHVTQGLTPEVVGNALVIILQTYVDGFHEHEDKQKVVDHLTKALPLMMLDHNGDSTVTH